MSFPLPLWFFFRLFSTLQSKLRRNAFFECENSIPNKTHPTTTNSATFPTWTDGRTDSIQNKSHIYPIWVWAEIFFYLSQNVSCCADKYLAKLPMTGFEPRILRCRKQLAQLTVSQQLPTYYSKFLDPCIVRCVPTMMRYLQCQAP